MITSSNGAVVVTPTPNVKANAVYQGGVAFDPDSGAMYVCGPTGSGMAWVLAQVGVPMIVPSSGSIGNNGALTGLTALPLAFAGCFMYFPAGTIAAGSAAGFYWVVMSTTQAGTIYNNTYTGGTPEIPTALVPFATVGPGAYAQTTGANIALLSGITLPAGAMGKQGSLELMGDLTTVNNANAKTFKVLFDATEIHSNTTLLTSQSTTFLHQVVRNRGSEAVQRISGENDRTAGSYSTVNTAAAVTISIAAQLATATDFIVLEGLTFKVVPGV